METGKFINFSRRFLILIFVIVLSLLIYCQIKVEIYRYDLIKLYNFSYLKKDRVKFVPFVYFIIESKIFEKNSCYFRNINLPYKEYENIHHIIRQPNEEYFIRFNIEYNAYLMYSYYNLEELRCN